MKYTLEYVTTKPHLWETSDPVRPELDVEFKTTPGRGVFGLLGEDGEWKAFLCYARTFLIPRNVKELDDFTSEDGNIIIPYTVWSHEKGAGRTIINEVLSVVSKTRLDIDRVVTLSPPTTMARKFHLRNDAIEFRVNDTTVNFEYEVTGESR
tara:strand:- start:4063 stop:4518 length:456 start_codon:yes stop_codon:yes gene_type:complete